MQKTFIVVLGVLVLALGLFTLQLQRKTAGQALEIATLRQTVAARDSALAGARKTAAGLETENRAYSSESTALRGKLAAQQPADNAVSSAAAATPTPVQAKDHDNPFSGMMDQIMNDPKMADVVAQQQMSVLKPMYADLVRQLRLSPAETEEFCKLLSEKTSQAMQAGLKMMSGDKQAADALTNADDPMKDLLGDRFSQYQAYEKTIPDRAQLTQISSALAARQVPLRPDQSNALLQVMQQEQLNTTTFSAASSNPASSALSEQMISDTYAATEERNARILAKSKFLLSADQQAALAEQQQQTLQMQKMGMEMAKSMFPAATK